MLKLTVALCVLVFVAAKSCHEDSECSCDNGMASCVSHHCQCTENVKRATCTEDSDCADSCPSGHPGTCHDNGHCDCSAPHKRAGETCTTVADCTGTCEHGLTMRCEKHNEHSDGHCHCAH